MESIGSDEGSLEANWSGFIGDLWVERFSSTGPDPTTPGVPILLLSEAEAPSTRWPDGLIGRLAASTGEVIRFDTRDVGRNPPTRGDYTLDDLAADAIAVLDHWEVSAAHVVGRSMGGMIAQLLALDWAPRVRTLTLLSTTGGPRDELGSPQQWLVDRMAERLFGDRPHSMAERVEWIVEQQEWFAGSRFPFDRASATAAAQIEAEHMWHDEIGHGLAVVNAPERYGRLGEISAPTLVVHGTADPVYPVAHGLALASGIAGARLELIEGLGHEVPDAFGAQLAELIASHIAAGV